MDGPNQLRVINRQDGTPQIDRSSQQYRRRGRVSGRKQKPSLAGQGACESRMVGAERLLVDAGRLPRYLQGGIEAALVGVEVRLPLEHLGAVHVPRADGLVMDLKRCFVRCPRSGAVATRMQSPAEDQLAGGHGGVGPVVDLAVCVQ